MEGPNGYSEPEENSNSLPDRERDKEVPRVQLSPTMRYSGLEMFAPKVQYVSNLYRCLSHALAFYLPIEVYTQFIRYTTPFTKMVHSYRP